MALASDDFYQDLDLVPGVDFQFQDEWTPLDLTGCTASFVCDFGTFSVAIAITTEGADVVSTMTVAIPAASTAAIPAGSYNWQRLVTFPGGQILRYGYGVVVSGTGLE